MRKNNIALVHCIKWILPWRRQMWTTVWRRIDDVTGPHSPTRLRSLIRGDWSALNQGFYVCWTSARTSSTQPDRDSVPFYFIFKRFTTKTTSKRRKDTRVPIASPRSPERRRRGGRSFAVIIDGGRTRGIRAFRTGRIDGWNLFVVTSATTMKPIINDGRLGVWCGSIGLITASIRVG